jgi:hypothetical protein
MSDKSNKVLKRECKKRGIRPAGLSQFECEKCGMVWTPGKGPGGIRLANGWWRCPKSCNVKGELDKTDNSDGHEF